MQNDLVHCTSCNWCYFQVSKDYVLKWEAEWKVLFDTKPAEWLELYGITTKPPSHEDGSYVTCFNCNGSYKNFVDGTGPRYNSGSTIQGILNRNEDL